MIFYDKSSTIKLSSSIKTQKGAFILKGKIVIGISSLLVISGITLGIATLSDHKQGDSVHHLDTSTEDVQVLIPTVQPWRDLNGNFREWVSTADSLLQENLDNPRIEEVEYDEGFIYYLKAEAVHYLEPVPHVEGEAIKKDLENLFSLYALIGHEQFVRTSHIEPNGLAKEDTDYYHLWEPTSDHMRRAFHFMEQIVHDLDIAVNHNGQGDTYGVTYLMKGENIAELENFWRFGR